MGSRWARSGARLKRSLEVLVEPDGERIAPPRVLCAGDTLLTVIDEGDGTASSRLASFLVEAGATLHDPGRAPQTNLDGLRIVIRAPALTVDGRHRAAALEAGAEVVLGSARPAFAARLVRVLLGDR